MDLFQLETFLAVAEERSFSRAAARLHRTQPAISQVIAKLEGELGETLLERADGTLTDAGEVLKGYAQKLLNLRTDAEAALVDLRSLHTGQLRLAANEYTCLYLLPVLDAFRRENPRIKVTVQRTLASRIADEVLSHSIDIGVVSFKPEDPQVRSIAVYRDELVCVVGAQHPLADVGKAGIQRLGRETFVAHNVPSPMRQKVIASFRRHKTPLAMEIELPSLDAIKRFVGMGNGIALIPRLTAEQELRNGTLVKITVPELAMERRLRLIQRKQTALSHAARAFLAVVEKHAEKHGDPFQFAPERS
ncbi:LysR family transcriptional regulator [Granulicella cerasi]|uniref:LysR family transcriptional regulator n=1 Tax=Granulicella cerasi TaxID=741063 RepID=A0ABW1Z750_9BACT|nr:LysR family transcriptional regulator [Granulicella cerasi]